VALYGSFNNWIQTKNYCAKENRGWVCRIDLAPGKYTYKFLVDGVGFNDPTNSATEDDGNGHFDSVNRHQAKIRIARFESRKRNARATFPHGFEPQTSFSRKTGNLACPGPRLLMTLIAPLRV
jgi:hypothetical protein